MVPGSPGVGICAAIAPGGFLPAFALASAAAWLRSMDSDTEASEPAPGQLTVPDQFGLIWEGSVRARPSFTWTKAASSEGLRVLCETADGLLEGVITHPGRRSHTGQIIVLGGSVRSYPNHLDERLQTLEGNIHLCMHEPCRQDTKGGTCTRRPSLHCRAASIVPDGVQLDLSTVWGVRRASQMSVGALVSAVADAVHDLTGSLAGLVGPPFPASVGDSLASDATGTTSRFSVINDQDPSTASSTPGPPPVST